MDHSPARPPLASVRPNVHDRTVSETVKVTCPKAVIDLDETDSDAAKNTPPKTVIDLDDSDSEISVVEGAQKKSRDSAAERNSAKFFLTRKGKGRMDWMPQSPSPLLLITISPQNL